MIHLTLLRHAKSDWSDAVRRDFDRPLNAKGTRAAGTMGTYLARKKWRFDRVLASPAIRVIDTLAGVRATLGHPLPVETDQRIYLASAATLIDVVQERGGTAAELLLAGHNPGLEDMVLALVPESDPLRAEVEIKYPTGALARIAFDCADWSRIAPGTGRLERFVRPRDLDPTLGPGH